jgi:urease gamma subunit
MNPSAHTLLAKRQEQERDRLAAQLATLLQQHRSVQEAIDTAVKNMSMIEAQLQDSFRRGMTGAELMAMESARQEQAARRESLTLQVEDLREEEHRLRQQMLDCENKGKAHTRAQEKLDHQQELHAERVAQQRLDDMMARRLGREGGH